MQPLTIALGNYGLTKPIKQAGVDLGTPGPAEAVVAQMDKRVSQLEAEIAKLQ